MAQTQRVEDEKLQKLTDSIVDEEEGKKSEHAAKIQVNHIS